MFITVYLLSSQMKLIKGHSGNGNGTGKNSGKGPTIKPLTRSIAALTTNIDKFSLPDNDDDKE
jgi:hypothetical protein